MLSHGGSFNAAIPALHTLNYIPRVLLKLKNCYIIDSAYKNLIMKVIITNLVEITSSRKNYITL